MPQKGEDDCLACKVIGTATMSGAALYSAHIFSTFPRAGFVFQKAFYLFTAVGFASAGVYRAVMESPPRRYSPTQRR